LGRNRCLALHNKHILKLSVKIFLGYALVLTLFSIVYVLNHKLMGIVKDNTAFLIKSEGIIRKSAQYQRSIIDMENSFRGFLLTGNEDFLKMYNQDSVNIRQLYVDMQSETADSSMQTTILYDIKNLYESWKNGFANPGIVLKKASLFQNDSDVSHSNFLHYQANIKADKAITDQIRSKFLSFNVYEYHLRDERRTKLNESLKAASANTLGLIAAAFAISLAAALYITKQISGRIFKMVSAAERVSSGELKIDLHDHHHDELSSLSQSLNKMAITLEENFTDLQQINTDLKQFAYIVSHDLKAPLKGIETVLTWIDDDFNKKLDPQLAEYLDMIRGRSKRMENLITGILEISKVGKNKKPVERVDVKELLMEIIETQSVPSGIKIEIGHNMPVLIIEKILLHQVFSNLIENAIKYHDTKKGHISITYRKREQHEFTVKDDGPGIDPAYHKKIFEMFQTLQERDAFESTGVGLALVKKIIEEKGGIVKVESNPGNGAAFTFTWPLFGELKS
jgi:signal transduction histidine kinase